MKNKSKCIDFERDSKISCKGDCEDCNVCIYNNKTTDTCMIGHGSDNLENWIA